MTDISPTYNKLARLGKIRPQQEARWETVRDQGNILAFLDLKQFGNAYSASTPVLANLNVRGYGVEFVSGWSTNTQPRVSANPSMPPIAWCNMASGEDQAGVVDRRREYRTDRGEIYDGALLAGQFERLAFRLRWVNLSTLDDVLVLRIYTSPLYRPVPVVPPRPNGQMVYDWHVARSLALDLTAQSIYDDEQPYWSTDPNQELIPGVQPSVGEGVGNDIAIGPHPSWKRRLLCHIRVTNTIAVVTGWVAYRNGFGGSAHAGVLGPWTSVSKVDSLGVTHGVLCIAEGADPANDKYGVPLYLPSGSIEIILKSDTDPTTALSWLTFFPG